MRIVFINSFYFPDEVGGAERSVRFLAESLTRDGHDVMVICSGKARESTAVNGVQVERVAVRNVYYPLDYAGRGRATKLAWHVIDSFNPLAAQDVGRLLSDYRADVMHSNTLSGFSVAVWGVAKRLGIPIVHTLRDYYLLCPNSAMFKRGKQCVGRCTECNVLAWPRKLASSAVQVVVGNSDFILQRHLEAGLFPAARSAVIYNAYAAEDALEDRREKGIVTLGFIGRIAATKGVDVLLSAVQSAAHLRERFRVLIAGSGDADYLDALKSRAAGLPVEFLGTVAPQAFYSRLDWCVVPSLWDEPLARVLFESFAHGVPVIGSRTGGTPELIEHGRNGFIYEANDVSALKDLIEQAVLMSDRQWLGMREACRIESLRFLPDQVVANYLDQYRAVAV